MANPGRFCGQGTTLWRKNPRLNSNNFIQGHVMKIEWLVTDLTAVGSSGKVECAVLGLILAGNFFANSGHICGI